MPGFDESFAGMSRNTGEHLRFMTPTLTPFAADLVPPEIIARSLRHPPSAPRVLPLLKLHLENVNTSVHQIVDLIRLDPGIAARVLQVGNSALHSRGSRCYTVDMAVQRIGFTHIYEIVANAVAEQVLVRPLTAYALEADELWNLSITCGIAAELIAEMRGEDPNIAYTLGLLHGVGMVAIDQWLQRHQPTVGFFAKCYPREYSESERVLIGCTHAEVGAEVLRGWDFPGEMAEPLRWQYNPLDSLAHRRMSSLLYAAKWVRSRVCFDDHRKPQPPEARLLAPLNLTVFSLERLVATVRDRHESVQRELDVGHDPQPFAA
jgi:HD-like signal output (HDOD) protein